MSISDVQATFFATLIDEWVSSGVTDAVVSPGNRSTLMAALLLRDGRIRVHVVVDERSASFLALGMGLASGRPTLLWTTSGTATAELHAAVIEAHQGRVPLLVCTADRPPELHHTRDWQSIDQSRLYGDTLRWQFDPGVATDQMSGTWRSIASRSVLETTSGPRGPGPVHLNLPIREPWSLDVGDLPTGRPGSPWHRPVVLEPTFEAVVVPGRGVLVVGACDVDAVAVHAAAIQLGWPVVADLRSGSRVAGANTIEMYDLLARTGALPKPEVIVHVGAPLLSKAFNSWSVDSKAEHWIVDPFDDWSGNKANAARTVAADPTAFVKALTNELDGEWLGQWRSVDDTARQVVTEKLSTDELTEAGIARELVKQLPAGSNLFAATSMPVRDVETFGPARRNLNVFANRGASGMDGMVSTAAGVSLATAKPTVLLTGDLSFLYDCGALWALRGAESPLDLTVVVVDNNGGGIFSTLPQLGAMAPDVFERVAGTPHGVDIPAVVEGFGLVCEEVESIEELMPTVRHSLEAGGMRIVYARTVRERSAAFRAEVAQAVSTALH